VLWHRDKFAFLVTLSFQHKLQYGEFNMKLKREKGALTYYRVQEHWDASCIDKTESAVMST